MEQGNRGPESDSSDSATKLPVAGEPEAGAEAKNVSKPNELSPFDFILEIGGREFKCHKEILSQHSHYFKVMFNSGMRESQTNRVSFTDVSVTHMETLLKYFYKGYLDIHLGNIQDITELSSRFQVESVHEKCCRFLTAITDEETCLKVMELSKLLMLPEVYDQSRKYALWHFSRVCQTECFLSTSPEQVVDYLRDPYLNIDSEVDVFKAAVLWYENGDELEKLIQVPDVVGFICSAVNFHLMNDEDVAQMKNLSDVKHSGQLKAFFNSSTLEEIIAREKEKGSPWKRTSPRDGRILCVGAHQCSLASCREIDLEGHCKTNPMEVLEFNPDGCSLEPFSELYGPYPELTSDAGYKVCAIGHLIYVTGGEPSFGKVGSWLKTIWCLNSFNGMWHKAGSLLRRRRHHGICVNGSSFILFGGIGQYRILEKSVECFDTEKEEWTVFPEMLHAEIEPAVVLHNEAIFVVKNFAQVFKLSTKTWSTLNLSPRIPGLPTCAYPCPKTNGIFLSFYNVPSLCLVDLDKKECKNVVKLDREGLGGVMCNGNFYHFERTDSLDQAFRTRVVCCNLTETSALGIGEMTHALLTAHFVTVPKFPRYRPPTGHS